MNERKNIKQYLVPIMHFAHDLFFTENSDADEDYEDMGDDKIYNFVEITVNKMNQVQFKLHFRMERTSFEKLLTMLNSVHVTTDVGRPQISLQKQTLIFIWYLANLECFRSIATRFGVSKSTCWLTLERISSLLLEVNKQFRIICWPDRQRTIKIMNSFYARSQIPGIVGVIDGSHIPIRAPKDFHISYINRKGFHSILLQGVCDNKKLFIDVYAGQVGSIHDWTLFKRSDLYRRIENKEIEFPNDGHLIGDLAYNLSPFLLTGFKDFGNLNDRKRKYNKCLNRARCVIENAFALLKGRFRRLKSFENNRLDLIVTLVISACILHNIGLTSDDDLEDMLNLNWEVEEERQINPDDDNANERVENEANIKRINIVNSLHLRE